MDVSKRTWMVKVDDREEGPIPEETFQQRLRAGEFSLRALIKSSFTDKWEPLLMVVASDESFRRPSTIPPPPMSDGE